LTIPGVSASLPVHKKDLMANSKSAAKRARQNPRRTLRNRGVVTRLRSLTKLSAAGGAKDTRALVSALDKAAKRGVIHKNVANRRKARLNKAAAKGSAA
jgi:small subunit ribosomal protein S20